MRNLWQSGIADNTETAKATDGQSGEGRVDWPTLTLRAKSYMPML